MAKVKKKTVVKKPTAAVTKKLVAGKKLAAAPAKVVGRKKKEGAVRMVLNAAKAMKHSVEKVAVKVVAPEVMSPPTVDVDEDLLLPGQDVEGDVGEAADVGAGAGGAGEATLQELSFEIKHDLQKRVDLYLRDRLPDYSRAMLQKLVKTGVVMVNERAAKSSTVLRSGDSVRVTLPKLSPTEALPENIPLDVVYEDEQFIALNKQAGLIVHPARGHWTGTMINALLYHVQNKSKDGKTLSSGTDPWRPGIIHRLDRDTTGLILVAKTDEAHWRLAGQFERRTIRKTYLALVHGNLELDSDLIDAPLAVHPKVREKYAVREDIGKPAQTVVTVKERFTIARSTGAPGASYTLVELAPKTGRTHQLRVHMAHVGHPIVGDSMYGGRQITLEDIDPKVQAAKHKTQSAEAMPVLITRQALHAFRLQFVHPTLFTRMHLEATVAPDIEHILMLLRVHQAK